MNRCPLHNFGTLLPFVFFCCTSSRLMNRRCCTRIRSRFASRRWGISDIGLGCLNRICLGDRTSELTEGRQGRTSACWAPVLFRGDCTPTASSHSDSGTVTEDDNTNVHASYWYSSTMLTRTLKRSTGSTSTTVALQRVLLYQYVRVPSRCIRKLNFISNKIKKLYAKSIFIENKIPNRSWPAGHPRARRIRWPKIFYLSVIIFKNLPVHYVLEFSYYRTTQSGVHTTLVLMSI